MSTRTKILGCLILQKQLKKNFEINQSLKHKKQEVNQQKESKQNLKEIVHGNEKGLFMYKGILRY